MKSLHALILPLVVLLPSSASAGDRLPETILYTALRPAGWDVFYFEASTGPPRRLTMHPDLDYNAVVSPDGRWVVFCSERRGNPDLFVIELGGKDPEPRLLLDSDAMEDAAAFSPDGKRLAFVCTRDGNADIFVMPFRPRQCSRLDAAVNLTRHLRGDFNPAFSPDGKTIVFSSDRDGYKASEIYAMNADGTGLNRLTASPGWDGSPVFSPDGKTIAFYSERDGRPRIYRMNADGSEQTPVTEKGLEALWPVFTPDGRVAYAARRDGDWQIESVRADGSDRRTETDAAGCGRDYWAADFHPRRGFVCHAATSDEPSVRFNSRTPGRFLVNDRDRVQLPDREVTVAAVRGYFPSINAGSGEVASDESFERIVISRLDGSNLREVFKPESDAAWRPSWSKDGDWIACTVGPTFAEPGENADIWKFRPDGSAAVNLTGASAANDAFPDFSPDGRQIVFRSGRDGNHEIYLMQSDGSHPRRLTHNDAVDTMPAFSPNGEAVAFTSNRDGGDYEVYLLPLNADGTPGEPHRVTKSPGRDTHPKFSPDGRWIVFASERGGMNDESPLIPVFNPQPYGDIYAVRLADGKTVRLTHNKWEDGTPTWGAARQKQSASQ